MASVVVVDYGSQYTRLITRRLRELKVFSIIAQPETSTKDLQAYEPAGVILSGGPQSVYDEGAPGIPPGLLDSGLPILAICYGMQLLATKLGGQVAPNSIREYGKTTLESFGGHLFEGIEGEFVAWMSHGDSVSRVPAGFQITGATADTQVAAMEDLERGYYALQFHPEVQHTPKGLTLLENFLQQIGIDRTWTPNNIVDSLTSEVQERVGGGRVLLGISGGVDSSTLGLLLHRALGDRLHAVFVDHGLLRQGEAEEVEGALRDLGIDLTVIDAADRFLKALKGVKDPERKRKRIGREFIEVFSASALSLQNKFGTIRYLAQGTLYPDIIESAGSHGAANIKSHHNVGGLPTNLTFELIEPFRNLFKDEVREIAKTLGLPQELRRRHPFPGPGFAIRCIGEVTSERLDILRRVDDIFVTGLREFGLYDDTWQALAILTPLRSVGVMGDGRTYAHTVALRAVSSVDGMTADWTRLPYDFLATVSNRIVNGVPEVNRVVYDITSKPPGTIEWE
ncbi:MAG: glutamine-hydrolyzing GMP synthase [Truepera sp.]|nr:glutamine-hydrolyzing GMP synthase [Truepera sp.]